MIETNKNTEDRKMIDETKLKMFSELVNAHLRVIPEIDKIQGCQDMAEALTVFSVDEVSELVDHYLLAEFPDAAQDLQDGFLRVWDTIAPDIFETLRHDRGRIMKTAMRGEEVQSAVIDFVGGDYWSVLAHCYSASDWKPETARIWRMLSKNRQQAILNAIFPPNQLFVG